MRSNRASNSRYPPVSAPVLPALPALVSSTEPKLGPKLLVSVEEAAWRLSIGKTTLYELIGSGVIRSVQIKRSRLVPVAELEAYVRALLAA